MINLLKQLAGESLIYGVSNIITRFISVFLMPLYTRAFSPEDYGVISIINSFLFFVSMLVLFSLDNASLRWYYDTEEITERKKTISSWFWFQTIFTFLISALIIVFVKTISNKLLHTEDTSIITYAIFGLSTGVLPIVVQNWLRIQRKALLTVFFSLSYAIVTIVLTVLFVLYQKTGVIGIFYAICVSNIVMSFVGVLIIYKWISLKYFSYNRLVEMLKYAAPYLPVSISFWLINSSAAFVLEYYHPMAEVGLFQLGITISSAVALFTSSFQMAWNPFAFSIMKQPNAKSVYSTVLTVYTILTSITVLLVSLFAKEILVIFTTPDYYEAKVVAGLLAFNSAIYSFVFFVGIGNNIIKNNKPFAVSAIIGALITVICMFLFIPTYGKIGAAYSMILGNIFIPIYVYISAQKKYYIPFNILFVVLIYSLSFVTFLFSLMVDSNLEGFQFSFKMLLGLMFILFSFIGLFLFDRKSYNSSIFLFKKYFIKK